MDIYFFDTIVGTPGWYYKKFPGFYNVSCYNLLAQWEGGVRTEEQVQKDKELEGIVAMDCCQNKKRERKSEEEELPSY